jgi:hypothetical protein
MALRNASFLPQRSLLLEPQRNRLLENKRRQHFLDSLSLDEQYKLGLDMPERAQSTPDPRPKWMSKIFNPNMERPSGLLPVGRHKAPGFLDPGGYQKGKRDWFTTPAWGVEAAKAGMLPFAVSKGFTPTVEDAAKFGLTFFGGGGSLIGKAPPGSLRAMVWHGSPTTWKPEKGYPLGRPNLSFKGAGTGQALRGPGVYMAESDRLGDVYRFTLTQDHPTHSYKGNILSKEGSFDPEAKVAYRVAYEDLDVQVQLKDAVNTRNQVREISLDASDPLTADILKELGDEIAALRSFDPSKMKRLEKGSVYKLNLSDEIIDNNLLEWSLPLSQQSSIVRKAFADMPDHITGEEAFQRLANRYSAPLTDDDRLEALLGLLSGGKMTDAVMPKRTTEGLEAKKADYAARVLSKLGVYGTKQFDRRSFQHLSMVKEGSIKAEAAHWLKQKNYNANEALTAFNASKSRLNFTPDTQQTIRTIIRASETKPQRVFNVWDQDILNKTKVLERTGGKMY